VSRGCGQTARMDSYENVAGPTAARVRAVSVRAAVGVPIIVDGRVWGLAAVGFLQHSPMPAGELRWKATPSQCWCNALAKDPDLRAALQAQIDRANADLADVEQSARRLSFIVGVSSSPPGTHSSVTSTQSLICAAIRTRSVSRPTSFPTSRTADPSATSRDQVRRVASWAS
jgi:hypothetical protein